MLISWLKYVALKYKSITSMKTFQIAKFLTTRSNIQQQQKEHFSEILSDVQLKESSMIIFSSHSLWCEWQG